MLKNVLLVIGALVFGVAMVLTTNYSFSLIDQSSTTKMISGIFLLFLVIGLCVLAFNLVLNLAKEKEKVLADEQKSDVTTKEKH